MSDSDPNRFVVTADVIVTEDALVTAYTHWVLHQCNGNKTHAARKLGIDRRSLYRRLGLCLDKREARPPVPDGMSDISDYDDEPYGAGV